VTFSRWREIEVHHVDLGLGYEPDEWPDDLAGRWLADLLPTLPDRTSPQQLLAWCPDRGIPPVLADWERSDGSVVGSDPRRTFGVSGGLVP
jgi:hypothetical protein